MKLIKTYTFLPLWIDTFRTLLKLISKNLSQALKNIAKWNEVLKHWTWRSCVIIWLFPCLWNIFTADEEQWSNKKAQEKLHWEKHTCSHAAPQILVVDRNYVKSGTLNDKTLQWWFCQCSWFFVWRILPQVFPGISLKVLTVLPALFSFCG